MLVKAKETNSVAKDAIAFVICAEKYYLKVSSCLIHSIIDKHSRSRDVDIILITTAGNEEICSKLVKEFRNFDRVRFNIIQFDSIDLRDFHAPIHFSSAMYLRLLIPEILINHKKVIYIDADAIVCEDISDLFDLDFRSKGYVCAAVWDEALKRYAQANEKIIVGEEYLSINFYFDRVMGISLDNYVNSGVMCLDLDALREMEFSRKAISLAKNKFAFPDQDVINILLEGKIYLIDKSFNFMPASQSATGSDILGYKVKIVHFAGPIKPWQNKKIHLAEYFWIHAARSYFYRDFEDVARQYINKGDVSVFDKWRVTRIIRKLCRGDKFYWEHLRLFFERYYSKISARRY